MQPQVETTFHFPASTKHGHSLPPSSNHPSLNSISVTTPSLCYCPVIFCMIFTFVSNGTAICLRSEWTDKLFATCHLSKNNFPISIQSMSLSLASLLPVFLPKPSTCFVFTSRMTPARGMPIQSKTVSIVQPHLHSSLPSALGLTQQKRLLYIYS